MKEKDTKLGQPGQPDRDHGAAGGIDWAHIRRRLEASCVALERKLAPSLEEKRIILRARAKLLAREPRQEEATTESLEVVEFLLAYEHYAFESKYIREIHPLRDFTPLPCTPPFVLGLISVRGQVLSVMDVRKFFDLPEKGLTDLNKVIIVHTDQMEVGILADAVLARRLIALQDLQLSLPTLTGIRAEYLKGVTKDSLVVLDVGRLLSDNRIIVEEEPNGQVDREVSRRGIL
jgi:purine-binding chemotaxis protein CheW